MILVFLGSPGCGKGTIAKKIQSSMGILHLSVGEVLRDIAEEKTPRGKKIKELIDAGSFVDDELVLEIIEERMDELGYEKGFSIDGFPRNLKQVELLDELMAKKEKKVNRVLLLECSHDLIVKRLTARAVCENCEAIYGLDVKPKKEGICDKCGSKLMKREDDKEDTIRKRIKVYDQKTAPLIELYDSREMLSRIDASKFVDEVVSETEKIVKEFKHH